MATKEELIAAYDGLTPNNEVYPYRILSTVVDESRSFLLGDGYNRNLELIANDPNQQEAINTLIEEINLYRHLNSVYREAFITGQGFISTYDQKLPRVIKDINVNDVKFAADNPLQVVYMKEKRQVYDPIQNGFKDVEVEHRLVTDKLPEGENLLVDIVYKYEFTIDNTVVTTSLNYIPIVRFVVELDDFDAKSPLDALIPYQKEFNDIRIRLHENNRHHKPLMVTIGTTAPEFLDRTDLVRPTDGGILRAQHTNSNATVCHLPISKNAADAGITPQAFYVQPQDSTSLERQLKLVEQDVYNHSGVLLASLQDARAATSSGSLRILFERLRKLTANRTSYLTASLKLIFQYIGADLPFKIEVPNMLPVSDDLEKLEIDKVTSKIISRKTALTRSGMTEAQADREIEQMEKEKTLQVQYSASLQENTNLNNNDNNSNSNR